VSAPRATAAAAQARRRRGAAALAPGLVLMAACFFLPLALLLAYSFLGYRAGEVVYRPTLANYASLLGSAFYWRIILRTVAVAAVSTGLTVVLGYPLAYQLARTRSRLRPLLVLFVVAPLLIGGVVRGYGWILILDRQGVVNSLLLGLHIVDRPVPLLFNFAGLVITMVEVLLPFFILPMIGVITNIDPAVERAAISVGAGRLRTFVHVTLPLSAAGVAAAASIVFSLASSIFVIPQIIGGASYLLLSTLAYQQIGMVDNWPFGSAVSAVMLAIALAVVAAVNAVAARRFTVAGR
jgi:putative spermidine/putrescine transport system permease protein